MSSNNESLSNKVGNATGGTVGDETLIHQAQTLASHTIDYAKGVTGLAHPPANPPTLGNLVNESRNLTASVLDTAAEIVSGVKKDVEHSETEHKAEGIVQKARELAGGAIETVSSYVAAAQTKAGEVTGEAQQKAGEVSDAASSKASQATDKATDAKNQAADKAGETKKQASDKAGQAQDQASDFTSHAEDELEANLKKVQAQHKA